MLDPAGINRHITHVNFTGGRADRYTNLNHITHVHTPQQSNDAKVTRVSERMCELQITHWELVMGQPVDFWFYEHPNICY